MRRGKEGWNISDKKIKKKKIGGITQLRGWKLAFQTEVRRVAVQGPRSPNKTPTLPRILLVSLSDALGSEVNRFPQSLNKKKDENG